LILFLSFVNKKLVQIFFLQKNKIKKKILNLIDIDMKQQI